MTKMFEEAIKTTKMKTATFATAQKIAAQPKVDIIARLRECGARFPDNNGDNGF